jgi:hypothetical protein
MRKTIILLTAAASLVAAAAPAFAAERLTDAQYIRANRCLGLTEAKALGEADTTALKELIKSQRGGRHDFTGERAANARTDAKREATKATDANKGALLEERDGPCKDLAAS